MDVLRRFTQLKCRLMPYLYSQAITAHRTGVPVMRAMLLEFPDDPTSAFLDRQYMLGDALLIAPVFSEDGMIEYYVPAGRWTNFLTGAVVEGPRWVRETHDVLSLPLLVRPDSVIAVGSASDRPDYAYGDDVFVQVYELADGQRAFAALPTTDGNVQATVFVQREGNAITVDWHGSVKKWRLLLAGITTATSVTGGAAERSERGVLITPEAATHNVTIVLTETA